MRISLPKIVPQISVEDTHDALKNNFDEVAFEWWKHQLGWINGVYETFRDHEKFLIVIYLVKKTLEIYSMKFKKFSMDEFFAYEKIQIENFNIIELSRALSIPKETVRRKMIELSEDGSIVKIKKEIILDRSSFPLMKPTKSILRTSIFLSKFSKVLSKKKIIHSPIKSEIFLEHLKKDFTYCWLLYYNLQIPSVINWKNYFKDLETWHVWALCIVNKTYQETKKKNMDIYLDLINKPEDEGLNAMTISDISGIPRATVVRKLKKLIKSEHLTIDDNKRYHSSFKHLKEFKVVHKKNMNLLSLFITNIYNQILN
jgi:predicted transcriptional regulator